MVFGSKGPPREPQETQKSPKRNQKRTKTTNKKIKNWTQKINIFFIKFGLIFGIKNAQKIFQKNHFFKQTKKAHFLQNEIYSR